MTINGPEVDGIDLVADWFAAMPAETWTGTVIKADGPFPASGNFAVIDVAEGEGFQGATVGLDTIDGTIDITAALVFSASNAAHARSFFSQVRRYCITEGLSNTVLLSVRSEAPVQLSATDARPDDWASSVTLTLYAQP